MAEMKVAGKQNLKDFYTELKKRFVVRQNNKNYLTSETGEDGYTKIEVDQIKEALEDKIEEVEEKIGNSAGGGGSSGEIGNVNIDFESTLDSQYYTFSTANLNKYLYYYKDEDGNYNKINQRLINEWDADGSLDNRIFYFNKLTSYTFNEGDAINAVSSSIWPSISINVNKVVNNKLYVPYNYTIDEEDGSTIHMIANKDFPSYFKYYLYDKDSLEYVQKTASEAKTLGTGSNAVCIDTIRTSPEEVKTIMEGIGVPDVSDKIEEAIDEQAGAIIEEKVNEALKDKVDNLITIDDALSETSENAVQNKVVNNKFTEYYTKDEIKNNYLPLTGGIIKGNISFDSNRGILLDDDNYISFNNAMQLYGKEGSSRTLADNYSDYNSGILTWTDLSGNYSSVYFGTLRDEEEQGGLYLIGDYGNPCRVANIKDPYYDHDAANKQYVDKLKPVKSSITLSTSWEGEGPYTQSITLSNATANSKVDLYPDAIVIQQMYDDGVIALYIENNEGVLTAYAIGAAPTAELTVQAIITEVASA